MTERPNIHNKWLELQEERRRKILPQVYEWLSPLVCDANLTEEPVEQKFKPPEWERNHIETEQATLGREVTVYPPHEYTVQEEGNILRGKTNKA